MLSYILRRMLLIIPTLLGILTVNFFIVQAAPAGAAPIATQEVGGHAALIEEHVLPRVMHRQVIAPLPALSRDVRPALLVGVHRFF